MNNPRNDSGSLAQYTDSFRFYSGDGDGHVRSPFFGPCINVGNNLSFHSFEIDFQCGVYLEIWFDLLRTSHSSDLLAQNGKTQNYFPQINFYLGNLDSSVADYWFSPLSSNNYQVARNPLSGTMSLGNHCVVETDFLNCYTVQDDIHGLNSDLTIVNSGFIKFNLYIPFVLPGNYNIGITVETNPAAFDGEATVYWHPGFIMKLIPLLERPVLYTSALEDTVNGDKFPRLEVSLRTNPISTPPIDTGVSSVEPWEII